MRATLKRFRAAGLSWPLPEEMTDAVLEARLFADAGTKQGHRRYIEPDWAAIHRELKRKHVTLSILWDEYIERDPQGYCKSASKIDPRIASPGMLPDKFPPMTWAASPNRIGVADGGKDQHGRARWCRR